MAYRNKYQRQKQQYSIDGGYSWVDVSPAKYRRGRLIEAASDDCNTEEWIEITGSWFCVGDETIERWVDDGTECVDYDKYNIQRRQISNDGGNTWTNTQDTRRGTLIETNSTDCGYVEYQYRWVVVSDDFICYGADKYEKQKEQRSSDGINWTDTGNVRRGTLFEKNSVDCGVTYTDFDCGIYFTYLNEYDRLFIDNDAATFNLISTLVNDMTGNIKVNFNFQIRKNMSDFDWVLRNANNVMVASNYIGRVVAGDFINDSFEVPCGDYNLLFVVNQESSYGTVTKYAMSRLTHICNDCENPPLERWVVVDNDYLCDNYNKYYKEKQQIYIEEQDIWQDTNKVRKGELIEEESEDCGYVPPAPDYSRQYLTFETMVGGLTFQFRNTGSNSLSYSLDDGETWTVLESSTSTPTVAAGSKIMWKGNCISQNGIGSFAESVTSYGSTFKVYGNIMSLVYGDNFQTSTIISENQFKNLFSGSIITDAENLVLPSTTLASQCYSAMFYNCTSLTTAPVLPATTLADYCYNGMFYGCAALTTAPELPATTLATKCYGGMFNGCTSLVTAPTLPATTLESSCYYGMFNRCTSLVNAPELPATALAQECYDGMFYGCTSLVNAPELPATTLERECYENMFRGCSRLNYIKMLATTLGYNSLNNWVRNVPTGSGTFVKAASMSSLPSGYNGIPTGWTVVDAT